MLWQGRRESSNVDDRRGMSGGKLAAGGGIIGIIALVINFLMGSGDGNIQLPQIPAQNKLSPQEEKADAQRAGFVKVVLADTEDVWGRILKQMDKNYPAPTLVLFRNTVESACGNASAASGPFYCPADRELYIDLSFYEELQTRFNASGNFAMAYVVAHEVGHHIQNLMGISEKMQHLRSQVSKEAYNRYSVRLELQADFYAGVWANHAQNIKTADGRNIIDSSDINEALKAANAIGDDRLQQEGQGYIVPESFTHGTSAQRMYWFKKGFETGDIKQGDTFNASTLE
ncbi:MAG: neutral zinc metallopeptidase [Ferruginibacter sp.]